MPCVPTEPTPATDGLARGQSLPAARFDLIVPITSLSYHSHPESANALFSTLGVRVQAEAMACRKARPHQVGPGLL